eukprot:TRINITY_DN23288_c0_g1_i1.p1 TRINITY_DN23288_c0_g1~~TRINITY_DN23288_c0_g1_i1.p1  ORF type:complete len:307 (+),score=71.18 TRINITY_DN23288_c0_g1_i1:60-980(+)
MTSEVFWNSYPAVFADRQTDGEASPEIMEECEEGMTALKVHFDEDTDTNIDGFKWENEKAAGGVEVQSSKAKSTPAKRFRIRFIVKNADCETIYNTTVHWQQRLKWDTESLSWGRYLKRFKATGGSDDDLLDVEAYTSKSAAGGAVSPRCFLDARLTRYTKNSSGEVTEIISSVRNIPSTASFSASVGAKELEARLSKTKIVRAKNNIGSGIRIQKQPNGDILVQMSAHPEIGGWLPVSVVNGATSGALIDTGKGVISAVKKAVARNKKNKGNNPQAEGGSATRIRVRIRAPGCTDPSAYSWMYRA